MEFFFVCFVVQFRKRVVIVMNDREIDYVVFYVFEMFVNVVFLQNEIIYYVFILKLEINNGIY